MIAQTTRMLAQKQPFIQRVRNSSLVEWSCAEDVPGLKRDTEAKDCLSSTLFLEASNSQMPQEARGEFEGTPSSEIVSTGFAGRAGRSRESVNKRAEGVIVRGT